MRSSDKFKVMPAYPQKGSLMNIRLIPYLV